MPNKAVPANALRLLSATRRQLLAGSAATLLSVPLKEAVPAGANPSGGQGAACDEALSLWRDWRVAHRETFLLCRAQQRLETRLAETVGFPPVGETATAADSAPQRARWEAADALLGYSAAKREEERAAAREQARAEALWAAPATSLAGVAAKLDALLRQGECCEDCPEFPWRQLRAAFEDLLRLGDLGALFSEEPAGE